MAPSSRKAGNFRSARTTKPKRYTRKTCSRVARRSLPPEPINVPELLYGLLNMDKHSRDSTEESPSTGRRSSSPVQKRTLRRKRGRSYDTSELDESSAGVSERQSTASSAESLTDAMDTGESSQASSSTAASTSCPKHLTSAMLAKDARALLEKKSLVRVIDDYIRTAIQEGKRRAKKYIRKALSFGMNAGYLIPGDSRGKVLHVSSSLIRPARKSNPALRDRRRRVRRGEDDDMTSGQRKPLRRDSALWPAKKEDSQQAPPKETPPSKKRKRAEANLSKTRGQTRKVKPRKSALDESLDVKVKERRKKAKTTVAEKPSKGKRGSRRDRQFARQRSEPPKKNIDKIRDGKRRDDSHELDNDVREDGYCRDERVDDDPTFVTERRRWPAVGRDSRSTKSDENARPMRFDEDGRDDEKVDENSEEMSNEIDDKKTTRDEA